VLAEGGSPSAGHDGGLCWPLAAVESARGEAAGDALALLERPAPSSTGPSLKDLPSSLSSHVGISASRTVAASSSGFRAGQPSVSARSASSRVLLAAAQLAG
jgi:hypothetical protein